MRIRSIKPGFFHNAVLATCPFEGRLLFAGLMLLADRAGLVEDQPHVIKGAVFPYDKRITPNRVDSLLEELHQKGFIKRDRWAVKPILHICTFVRHQRLTNWEAKDSKMIISENEAYDRGLFERPVAPLQGQPIKSAVTVEDTSKESSEATSKVTSEVTSEESSEGTSPLNILNSLKEMESVRNEAERTVFAARIFRSINRQCGLFPVERVAGVIRKYGHADLGEALRNFDLHWGATGFSDRQNALTIFDGYLSKSESTKKNVRPPESAGAQLLRSL